jgi:hypothetical protein
MADVLETNKQVQIVVSKRLSSAMMPMRHSPPWRVRSSQNWVEQGESGEEWTSWQLVLTWLVYAVSQSDLLQETVEETADSLVTSL